MCIVIDANAAHHMHAKDDDGKVVLRWLLKGPGKLIVSADLLKELAKTHLKSILLTLDRAGKLIKANDARCEATRTQIESSKLAVSNNSHVLALIVETRCDVVFTHDQPLHRDLKNKAIVPHQCSIYQNASHRGLLGACHC